ncbi:MAG: PilN domain-containing protein [Planctomycetota bacterium]
MNNIFRQSGEQQGSFLPSEYVQAKSELRTNLISVLLFGTVMIAVVSAFLVTNRRWEQVKTEQARIEAQYTEEAQKIDQLKSLESQREEMIARASVTTVLLEKVPRSVLFAELVTRMPEELRLVKVELLSKRILAKKAPIPEKGKVKSLKATQDGAEKAKAAPPRFVFSLQIEGLARRNNEVADYLAELKDCGLLEEVELEYIRDTIQGDELLRRFRIVSKLRPDADAERLDLVAQYRPAKVVTGEKPVVTGMGRIGGDDSASNLTIEERRVVAAASLFKLFSETSVDFDLVSVTAIPGSGEE